MGESPVRVVLDVGREVERGAGLQHAGELAERCWRDEAALVVAGFRPRIGVEQVGGVERGGGELDQKLQRVVGVEADVVEALLIDGLNKLGYPA
jgi:hypothetical protein